MTDDSYHMLIYIGIGIGISIGIIFSSVFGIESIGKSGIGPPLMSTATISHDLVVTIGCKGTGLLADALEI